MESSGDHGFVLRKKHPLWTRLLHWFNFLVLGVMVWSGMLIYWANDAYRIGWGGWTLFKFFPTSAYDRFWPRSPLAPGMAWHFTFMWLFMGIGVFYVGLSLVTGKWRELAPYRGIFRDAIQVVLHDLKIRKEPLPDVKFNAAQRLAYAGIIFCGVLSTLTGLAIYKPVQLGWLTFLLGGYQFARVIHFVLTLNYAVFLVVHVSQVIKAGWNNFRAMVIGVELAPRVIPEDHP